MTNQVTYSIFFPYVEGISNEYKGCDPFHYIGWIFDDSEDHTFQIKLTTFKGYKGLLLTSPSRDHIWSCQDLTDHGHCGISEEYRQELIDIDSWTNEDQMYYEYRQILDDINEGLN
jgi:hypothetical protein